MVTKNPLVTTISTVKTKKSSEKEEKQSVISPTLIDVPAASTATKDSAVGLGITESTSLKGAHDAFLGVPEVNELLLPDLGVSREPTNDEVITQAWNTVREHSQDHSQEDKQDAVDALLSLSTAPNPDFDFGIEDNAQLVPIGGKHYL